MDILSKKRNVEEILMDDSLLDDEFVEKISGKEYLSDEKLNALTDSGLRKMNSGNGQKNETKIEVVHKRNNFGYIAAALAFTVGLTVFIKNLSENNIISPFSDSRTESFCSDSIAEPEKKAEEYPELKKQHIYIYNSNMDYETEMDINQEYIQFMAFGGKNLYICSSDFDFRNLKLTVVNRETQKVTCLSDIADEGWVKYIKTENADSPEIIYQYKDELKSVSFSTDENFHDEKILDNISPSPAAPEIPGIYSCEILFSAEANGFMGFDYIYVKNDGNVYGYKENSNESSVIISGLRTDERIPCAAADENGFAVVK